MAKKSTDGPPGGITYPSTSKTLGTADVPTDQSHGSNLPLDTLETNVCEDDAIEVPAKATPIGIQAHAMAGATPTAVQSVYASTAAAFPGTADQNAVIELEETFTNLASPVLYAMAHDSEPIGPRIGGSNVPEPTLKALAGYEWERRKAVDE